MAEQTHSAMRGNLENRYATCQDFLKVFDEDMQGLYQLSFLLAGDHKEGERCFLAGMEDCAKENRVFREWARTWAKRMIVQNAIRVLQPRPSHSHSVVLVPTAFAHKNGSSEHFDVDAVLGLADFERFVFVLCVLERYREHECALLLGCSASEVREARTQAIQELAKFRPNVFDVYRNRECRRPGRSAQGVMGLDTKALAGLTIVEASPNHLESRRRMLSRFLKSGSSSTDEQ